jgi:[ribosomal protein S18]-alanine N-acetyltransferase
MNYTIAPMTKALATMIASWEYEPPYQIYNLNHDEAAINEFCEQDYWVLLNEQEEIIGFYCYGEAAKIPYGNLYHVYDENQYLDFGVGLNPNYTNQGFGEQFIHMGLNFIKKQTDYDKFRLSVFDYNIRAIKVYEQCGFKAKSYFKSSFNDLVHVVVMVKE